MGRIDIERLRQVIVELAEIRTYHRITDRTPRVEFAFHIVAEFHADIRQGILIAQTPDEYRRMVLVTPDSCLRPLLQHGIERGV